MSTSPQDYPPETWHLLYENEEGKVVGLDRVQLLNPVPTDRFAPARVLLRSADLYLVYQAALVLTAWGDPAGLLQIETMVDARVDRQMEFAPHRIYDYDNVYDEMAKAVYLYGLSSDAHLEDPPARLPQAARALRPVSIRVELEACFAEDELCGRIGS